MKPKLVILLMLIVISIFLISGCSKVVEEVSKEPIKIGLNIWPGYAYIYIAQEKGFFEQNGVEVELILKEDYSEVQKLHHQQDIPIDGILEVFSDTISHNIKGTISSQVVYVFDYSESGDVIIAQPEITSLTDLKGKTVGVDGINTFSHIFVLTDLEKNGVLGSDVTFKDVSALDILEALEDGKIDAGHTWEPIKSQALTKGYVQIGSAEDVEGIITDVLSFEVKTIEERPEDVQAIVKSLNEAYKYFINNPEESLEIMASAEGMSVEEMREGIKGVHLLDLKDNQFAFSYAGGYESLYGSARRINEFMINHGVIDQEIDSRLYVNPSFIGDLENGK